MHAVGRRTPAPDDTVAVIGAGMIGLLVIQVLRAGGCRRIIAVDLDDHRLALAGRFGAAWQWRADAVDVPAAVRDLTEGRGADAVFEVVGIASTLAAAVASLRKGGELVLVGNVSPRVELPLQAVVTRELSLRGSCASCGEYPKCLDMIARGAVDVDPLTSAVAPLAEGAVWFDRLHSGESGLLKVVLEPGLGVGD
jgi:L-iditol 2-dehydrogenase